MSKIKRIRVGETWKCECGETHDSGGAWVAAHWDEELTHTCPKCGNIHTLKGGTIRLVAKGAKR